MVEPNSLTIKPNLTSGRIRKYVTTDDAEALRESQQRREHLQKLATMHAGQQIYVEVQGDSAYADIMSAGSELGYTDRTIINVRAEIPDQVATNLDQDVWDMLVQKCDLYHELGHVLWTDWPSYEEVVFGGDSDQFGVPPGDRGLFHHWWNWIEDTAIERFLCDRFNIADDLRVYNENIRRGNKPDKMVPLHQAIVMAIAEYRHPIGWVDKLLDESDDEFQFLHSNDRELFEDEILPIVEDRVPDIIEESDPVERNHQIYGFYLAVIDYLDDAVSASHDEPKFLGDRDDAANQGDASDGDDADSASMPEFDPPDPADIDPEDAKYVDLDAVRDGIDSQVQQQRQQMEQEDNTKENLEKWSRVIDREYDTGATMTLEVPEDPPEHGSFDDATYQQAQQMAGPLEREFREQLRQQRRSNKQTGRKSGKVDSKRIHKASKGETNVFTKTTDPDDKEYTCITVIDRSGSMSSTQMDKVEAAAGAFAIGLDNVGVDISQLSITENDIHLEKDFGEDVSEAKAKMFRGYSGGSTPLSDALQLAKARVDLGDGKPFVIVITDGEPDHRERYRDVLDQCDFPVLGIYVTSSGSFDDDHMNESAYFHELQLREYGEALAGARALASNVMF